MQKKIWLIILVFLLLPAAVTATVFYRSFVKGATQIIVLKENGFVPQEITINKGDTIQFKTEQGKQFWPASDLHPTHGIYPEFDPQEPIEPDKTWSFTFNKSGIWRYHDHLSPFYRATITVK